jgi:Ca2+-transporting ATPase
MALSGPELDRESVEQLAQQIDNVSVFYRTTPHHKVKIVEAFKRKGRIFLAFFSS